jgi:hypothetical protein
MPKSINDLRRLEIDIDRSQEHLEQTATAGIKAKKARDKYEDSNKELKDNKESLVYEKASPIQIIGYVFAISLCPILIGTSIFLNHDSIEAIVGKYSPSSFKQMAYWLIPIGTFILAICVKIGENFARQNNKPTRMFKFIGWLLLLITPIFIISILTIKPITTSSFLLTLGKILLITVPELLVLYCGNLILVALGFFLYRILRPYYELRANRADSEFNTHIDTVREDYPKDIALVNEYNNSNPPQPIALGRFSAPTTQFINEALGLEPPPAGDRVTKAPKDPSPPTNPGANNDPEDLPPPPAPKGNNNTPTPGAQTPVEPTPANNPAPADPEAHNDLEDYYRNQAEAMARRADGEVQP